MRAIQWFQPKKTKPLPSEPVNYPSDVVVETESGWYFIKGKNKLRIHSQRCLDSWSVDVLQGTDESVSKFKSAGVLGFRNGTLVKDISTGKYYLISENKKRHIVSPDVFDYMGFDISKAMVVAADELFIHEEGEVLS